MYFKYIPPKGRKKTVGPQIIDIEGSTEKDTPKRGRRPAKKAETSKASAEVKSADTKKTKKSGTAKMAEKSASEKSAAAKSGAPKTRGRKGDKSKDPS